MREAVELVLVLLLMTNLLVLGSGLLSTCIRIVALQGVAVALLPLLLHEGPLARALAVSGVTMAMKGVVFPFLLGRVLREVNARREVEPYVGHTLSLIGGVAALMLSFWVSGRLSLPGAAGSSLMVPAGLTTVLVGLFLIVSRRKAITQVLGYIVMENGIYTLGVALVGRVPALLELGVLLDAFVAIFIMGIATYHINREFEHIDVDQLDTMKG